MTNKQQEQAPKPKSKCWICEVEIKSEIYKILDKELCYDCYCL
jgi:hypothetical protein